MIQEFREHQSDLPAPAPRTRHVMLLIGLLVLATVPVITVAEPYSSRRGEAKVIATDALHLRDCPSLTCRIVSRVPLGSEVEITGKNTDGFVPVRHGDASGWAWPIFLAAPDRSPMLREGVAGCNRVAIIFNAGIGHAPSGAILSTLAESQIPVTVFAMGWWADAYPDYLLALDRDTRAVFGSHGDTQTFLTDADDARVVSEIHSSASRIEAVLGYPIARFYTPYAMDTDRRVESLIAEEGYLPIGWTVSAADYRDDDTAEGVADRVFAGVRDGAIIELHLDGEATDRSTAQALPVIIAELQERGLTMVSVPEIVLPCPPIP